MTRQTLARLLGNLAALILVAGIGLFSFGLATATDETFEESLFYGGVTLSPLLLRQVVYRPATNCRISAASTLLTSPSPFMSASP